MTRTKHLGLEDGALLGGPVLPMGVEGAGVLHRLVVLSPATAGHLNCLGLGAVALQPPGVTKQSCIRVKQARWRLLVVRSVRVVVSTQAFNLYRHRDKICPAWPTLPAHCGLILTVTLLLPSQITTRPRSATWRHS